LNDEIVAVDNKKENPRIPRALDKLEVERRVQNFWLGKFILESY